MAELGNTITVKVEFDEELRQVIMSIDKRLKRLEECEFSHTDFTSRKTLKTLDDDLDRHPGSLFKNDDRRD